MFGKRERELARLRAIEEAHNALMLQVQSMIDASNTLQKRPILLDIQREGRVLKFTFVRDGNVYVIETMAMMADNVKQWKTDLGLMP